MGVYFKTQQGRTLRNDEMTVDDMTRAIGSVVEVVGYDEQWRYINPSVLGQAAFHANTRHVVEWWETPTTANWGVDSRVDAGVRYA